YTSTVCHSDKDCPPDFPFCSVSIGQCFRRIPSANGPTVDTTSGSVRGSVKQDTPPNQPTTVAQIPTYQETSVPMGVRRLGGMIMPPAVSTAPLPTKLTASAAVTRPCADGNRDFFVGTITWNANPGGLLTPQDKMFAAVPNCPE